MKFILYLTLFFKIVNSISDKNFELSTWSYYNKNVHMWKTEDWLKKDLFGNYKPLFNRILVTKNNTHYANLHYEIYQKTNMKLKVYWAYENWSKFNGDKDKIRDSFQLFVNEYEFLKSKFNTLSDKPYGIFLADEPSEKELYINLEITLDIIKEFYPNTITYMNFLYKSIVPKSNNVGIGPLLGKVKLDLISSDEYYDIDVKSYIESYKSKLYPYLQPKQKIILTSFSAYCELKCPVGEKLDLFEAENMSLFKTSGIISYYYWYVFDDRVTGIFAYRFKNIWRADNDDVCMNMSGNGLGLIDKCQNGNYATPLTLDYYKSFELYY